MSRRRWFFAASGLAAAVIAAFVLQTHGALSPPAAVRTAARAPSPVDAAAGIAAARLPVDAATQPVRVVVQVVDSSEAPRTGVPVTLLWGQRDEEEALGRSAGARAEVVIADLLALRARARDRKYGDVTSCQVAVPCLGCAGPRQPLVLEGPQRPAEQRVRLVLPPSGSVTIRVADADGNALHQQVETVLEILDDQGEVEVRDHQDPLGVFVDARFVPLVLGRNLRVSGNAIGYHGNWFELTARTIAGPVRDGEDVVAEYRLPRECPILAGTLVNPDGAPLRDATVRWSIKGEAVSCWVRVRTDALGRVRCALPVQGAGTAITELWCDEIGERGETARRALFDVHPRLHAGEQELGTGTMAEVPLIVGFRIVDQDGKSMRKAWLSMRPVGPIPDQPVTTYGSEGKALRFESGVNEIRNGSQTLDYYARAIADGFEPSAERVVHRGDADLVFVIDTRKRVDKR